MRHFHTLNFLQKHILNNAKIIYDFIIKCNIRHKKPSKIFFKLKYIDENTLIAQDIYSKTVVELRMDNQYIVGMIIRINQHSCTIRYKLED